MRYTLETNKRYAAEVRLTGIQEAASNEFIEEMFVDYGFKQVNVTGEGSTRIVHGTWGKESLSGRLPNEVIYVEEM